MSLLRDHITEFVASFDPSDEDAVEAFREAVADHFTPPEQPEARQRYSLRRSVVEVEVLWNIASYGPEPPDWTDLMALAAEGFDGSASLSASVTSEESVSRSRMADLLDAQGRDPEFLGSICRFPGCNDDPDDGEGWDGWCGHHADTIEAHRANDCDHDPVERADCAVCAGHSDPASV